MSTTSSFVQKPVQEQVENGEEFSERYIYKGQDAHTINTYLPLADIPVVDLQKLSFLCPERDDELKHLKSALSSWGCFQAVNHGMATSKMEEMREATKSFFAIPKEEKQKYARLEKMYEGYGNDILLSEEQVLDWSDRLYLTVMPKSQRKLKYWPLMPPNFRGVLNEYVDSIEQIGQVVCKSMAVSLGLDEYSFLKMYGKVPKMYSRFNLYPRCPRPDLALGVKPHTDKSAITILLQDKEVEGLQIKRHDDTHQWFRVPTIPNALLINVGDHIEIMSNGEFRSVVHRVSANATKDRISVAVFFMPDRECEIGPAAGLVDETRPRRYKNVKNYYQEYKLGLNSIDAAKIL